MMKEGTRRYKESSIQVRVEIPVCIYLKEKHGEYHELRNAYTTRIYDVVVYPSNMLPHGTQICAACIQPMSMCMLHKPLSQQYEVN